MYFSRARWHTGKANPDVIFVEWGTTRFVVPQTFIDSFMRVCRVAKKEFNLEFKESREYLWNRFAGALNPIIDAVRKSMLAHHTIQSVRGDAVR